MHFLMMALALAGSQAAPARPAEPGAAGTQPSSTRQTISFRSLPRESRAPVPYEMVNGHILFRAKVAGRDVWMLLDNMATPSAIDTALAVAAGLRVDQPSGTIRTPTGSVPKRRVWDVPILVPGQMEVKMSLAAIDLSFVSKSAERKIEAVFGGDLLSNMAIKVDSGRKQLTLGPSGSSNVSPVIPMIPLKNGRAQLDLLIGDKPVSVLLDLGSNGGLSLTPEAWARIGSKDAVFRSGMTAHVEGQVYATDVTTVPEVKLGTLTRKDVRVVVRPYPNLPADGIMGTAMLADANFLLDIKAGKLWILPRLASSR